MVINALDFVPHCYSGHDGAVINALLSAQLEKGRPTTLSLAGVDDVPSSFVNAALIALLEDFDYDFIKTHLTISEATKQAAEMIRRCFRNAVEQRQAA